MKKKLLVIIAVFALILGARIAETNAFSLGGYVGEVQVDFINWDMSVGTYTAGDLDPTVDSDGDGDPTNDIDGVFIDNGGTGDGIQDSWGLVKVGTIWDDTGSTALWQSGQDGEYIEGWFYGVDDDVVMLDANLDGVIYSVGGTLDLYINNVDNLITEDADILAAFGAGAFPLSGPPTDVFNATDGTLFLSIDFAPGILNPLLGAVADTTTWVTDLDPLNVPPGGSADGYGDITGGLYAAMFDTNGYVLDGGTKIRDVKISNDFDESGTSANSFTFTSDGITDGSAQVIPEPTTVALLGIGLVGMTGVAVRRKMKKKTVEKS